MMKVVELIYELDCPNVEQARTHLLAAFSKVGLFAKWAEWDGGDSSSPSRVRSYGSPTILVEGKDVANEDPSLGMSSCRLYSGSDGKMQGAPSVEMIVSALRHYGEGKPSTVVEDKRSGWRTSFAVLPGIGASLLPVGFCPACWPAYAGLLSVLGLGFLLETSYLLPLTGFFLAVAVASMAYRAKGRRGYGPFVLGLIAVTVVFVGKFVSESSTAMYGGLITLIGASLWNAWPKKQIGSTKETCAACASREAGLETGETEGTNE
ncbi:MAG: MerC domain-containing protein [Opitutaceae bacterium]|nr:MerC domain-containing protein [Opitutaceae bacterium]